MWLIWQAVDRKPTEFLAALQIPSRLWRFLTNMDSLFQTMMIQKTKKDTAKNG